MIRWVWKGRSQDTPEVTGEVSLVRFFCEWCFERVDIISEESAHAEVLHHFTACPRRPQNATDKTVAGLASHITSIIIGGDESATEEKNGNVA